MGLWAWFRIILGGSTWLVVEDSGGGAKSVEFDEKRFFLGDPEIWEALFDDLYGIALSRVKRSASIVRGGDEEDAAIEIVEAFINKMGEGVGKETLSFKSFDDVKRYFSAHSKGRSIDADRFYSAGKRGGGKLGSLDDIVEQRGVEFEDPKNKPVTQMDFEAFQVRLRAFLENAIDPKYREIFIRHHIDGMSLDEIAEELGVSKPRVSVWFCRVLDRVRKQLDKEPELKLWFRQFMG